MDIHTYKTMIHITFSKAYFLLNEFLQTSKLTQDLIERFLGKAWKGFYLNGADIPKPKAEDVVEVLQSAEITHKSTSGNTIRRK